MHLDRLPQGHQRERISNHGAPCTKPDHAIILKKKKIEQFHLHHNNYEDSLSNHKYFKANFTKPSKQTEVRIHLIEINIKLAVEF